LKYNQRQKKFSLKLNGDLPNFNKDVKKIILKSEFTEKYVLSYCEI
jgi:hypothetical protein